MYCPPCQRGACVGSGPVPGNWPHIGNYAASLQGRLGERWGRGGLVFGGHGHPVGETGAARKMRDFTHKTGHCPDRSAHA